VRQPVRRIRSVKVNFNSYAWHGRVESQDPAELDPFLRTKMLSRPAPDLQSLSSMCRFLEVICRLCDTKTAQHAKSRKTRFTTRCHRAAFQKSAGRFEMVGVNLHRYALHDRIQGKDNAKFILLAD